MCVFSPLLYICLSLCCAYVVFLFCFLLILILLGSWLFHFSIATSLWRDFFWRYSSKFCLSFACGDGFTQLEHTCTGEWKKMLENLLLWPLLLELPSNPLQDTFHETKVLILREQRLNCQTRHTHLTRNFGHRTSNGCWTSGPLTVVQLITIFFLVMRCTVCDSSEQGIMQYPIQYCLWPFATCNTVCNYYTHHLATSGDYSYSSIVQREYTESTNYPRNYKLGNHGHKFKILNKIWNTSYENYSKWEILDVKTNYK